MSDYDPVKCLQEEVARWAANQSASMPVTGFYVQAAVVLDEHKNQKKRIAELERELADAQEAIKIYQSRDIQACQQKPKEDWSMLNSQVVGGETQFAELEVRASLAQLEREKADLKKAVADYVQLCGDLANDREKLRLQVVRLREALEGMSELCGNYFDEKGLVCARDKEIWALHLKALAETPAQCAKEVIGPTVELLRMACDDGEGNLDRAKKLGEDISKFHPTVPLYRKEIARLKRLFE